MLRLSACFGRFHAEHAGFPCLRKSVFAAYTGRRRAGRGNKPGYVILQVYDADNRTVHLAAAQDYDTFAKEELLRRKELNYPPYAAFLKITVWDKNEERANGTAKEIADFLERQAKNTDAEVFGPFAGIIGKVRDLYRVNVLVKSTQINIFKTALCSRRTVT